MSIDDYTPCRISECFLDQNEEIEIINITGVFRLKGIGREIWNMLDGKHTVRCIAESLCEKLSLDKKEIIKVQEELIAVLDVLNRKKAIIVNWDPIYKFENEQELLQ